MGREAAAGALAEHREPEGEQQILQYLHISRDRADPSRHLAGHRAQVQRRALGEGHRFEEPGEGADVAGKPLGANFLVQVEGGEAAESRLGVGVGHHQRQETPPERRVEVEGVAQLGGHEGVEPAVRRPSAEEVHPAAPKLPGAGAGQRETNRQL